MGSSACTSNATVNAVATLASGLSLMKENVQEMRTERGIRVNARLVLFKGLKKEIANHSGPSPSSVDVRNDPPKHCTRYQQADSTHPVRKEDYKRLQDSTLPNKPSFLARMPLD
jgi:hypothetical protein